LKKFVVIILGLVISNMLYALALDANSWNDSKIAYYNRVKMCFPGRFENDESTVVYRVYGRRNNTCDISERRDKRVVRCLLPLDVAKLYATSGLATMKEHEDFNYMLFDFLVSNHENLKYCRAYNVTE